MGCSYANAEGPHGLHTTALGAGPEVYNNMAASVMGTTRFLLPGLHSDPSLLDLQRQNKRYIS